MALLIAGCTASGDEVHPPSDQLYFPSGLALAPKEHVLFVANANSELRFDSGSISVIDVDLVQAAIDQWTTGSRTVLDGCQQESDHTETMVCEEAKFMRVDAGIRIGNFATDIGMQVFANPDPAEEDTLRLFVPTRGDPSIAWADYRDGALQCSDDSGGFALCDDAHRLSQLQNDPDLDAIPDEPFGVFADGPNGFAMVSHLSGGAITLIAAPQAGEVRVVDVRQGFFAPDTSTGLPGATGIVGRNPGASTGANQTGDIVYVGSRSDHRVQTFTVGALPVGPPPSETEPPPTEAAYLVPSNFFLLGSVGNQVGGSNDTRGMQFAPGGDRLYLANRQPPSLQIFDTSLAPSGFPRNTALGAIDICRQASNIAVLDDGISERAYVTCFQDGQVYVVDRRNLAQPDDIVLVGRGPYSVVVAPQRKLLFVSNVLEDTIAVVDLRPGSATHNRVVLRIGTPREL